jgi:hypothetical protein
VALYLLFFLHLFILFGQLVPNGHGKNLSLFILLRSLLGRPAKILLFLCPSLYLVRNLSKVVYGVHTICRFLYCSSDSNETNDNYWNEIDWYLDTM